MDNIFEIKYSENAKAAGGYHRADGGGLRRVSEAFKCPSRGWKRL